MAFIFETVPQEDIEKYGLAELHRHYSELAKNWYGVRTGLKNGYPWMVDRGREIWFMLMGIGTIEDNPPIATGKDYYILYYKDQNIEVIMSDNRKEGSTKFSDTPFRIRWEIQSISPESFDGVKMQEMIDIITQAMIARGDKSVEKFTTDLDIQVKYIGGNH